MTDKKRIAQLTARLLAGAIVAVAATAGVTAAVLLPAAPVAQPRPAITAQPAAGVTSLGCSGPLIALGRDLANTQALSVAAFADFTFSDVAGVRQEPITMLDVADPRAFIFAADPVDDTRIALAAAGSVTVAAPDLTGFAAFACQPASMQSWIVGGDTLTGTSGVLTLTNPGDVTAIVDVTVYAEAGPRTTPGSTGIVVAAKSTMAIDIAAIAGDASSPVLRIDSHDTPILANLQSGIVRTLVTGGADVQSSVSVPSTSQVIPGVVVADDANSGRDYQRLRVLATDQATTATIGVRAVGAANDAFTIDVEVQGGIPQDVELPSLPAGDYVVTVSAEQDVVAATWSTTGYHEGSDFAWAVSAPTLRAGVTPFAVPAGDSPSLTVVNTADTAVAVTIETSEQVETLTIEPGTPQSIPLPDSSVASITFDEGSISAAVSFAGTDAIASMPVWPADAAAAPVVVRR